METPPEKRFQQVHTGHCTFLVPAERRFVTKAGIQGVCFVGTPDEIIERLRTAERAGLREVTLLPSHWDWLNVQPGGASVALRKLVDAARRTSGDRDRVRAAQESTYRFISAIAGNLPGFEEATRALFAYDRRRFGDLISGWPEDIRDYAIRLAFADHDAAG